MLLPSTALRDLAYRAHYLDKLIDVRIQRQILVLRYCGSKSHATERNGPQTCILDYLLSGPTLTPGPPPLPSVKSIIASEKFAMLHEVVAFCFHPRSLVVVIKPRSHHF